MRPKNGFYDPTKHPKPSRGPLERARDPDQPPTGPFVGMGPVEPDGAQVKSQLAARADGDPKSRAYGILW